MVPQLQFQARAALVFGELHNSILMDRVRGISYQAAGEQGLPTGSGLSGLGQWVPLPSAQGEMGMAVCGGHLSRQRKDGAPVGQAEVQHRAFLQGHEKRVFFGAIRPENPLRGASLPGALLSRLPAGALGADGAGGRGADLAGGGQGVPAPSLARTCSSGGTGGTSCPRPLAPTAG